MNIDNSIHLIGRIREHANNFILSELSKNGVTDIVISHGDIIATLFKYKELTLTEIAIAINRDRATVTALRNKLIKFGYIQSRNNPDDNRSSLISLTEKGLKLKPLFYEISEKLFEKGYRGINKEEREIFLEILNKIHRNWKE